MTTLKHDLPVVCTGCGAEMSDFEFNRHICPSIVTTPRKGESFENFKARNEKLRKGQ